MLDLGGELTGNFNTLNQKVQARGTQNPGSDQEIACCALSML